MNKHTPHYGMTKRQYRNTTICLVLFGILFVLVTLLAPLNIIISGPSTEFRDEINQVLNNVIMLPLALLLFFLSIVYFNPIFTNRDAINLLILFSWMATFLLHNLLTWSMPSYVRLMQWTLIILSTYCTFRFAPIRREYFSWIFRYTYLFASGLTLFIGYYFYKNDMLLYTISSALGIARPQIGGTLLQSTEQSNLLACILLFVPAVWIGCKRTVDKILVITASIPLIFFFAIMFSIGSFISFLFMALVFFCGQMSLKKVRKITMTLIFTSFVSVILLLPFYESTSRVVEDIHEAGEAVINKIEDDNKRVIIYSDLWEMIKKDPIIGAGWLEYSERTGDYPHHNILGIWAELGILTMLAYLLNFFICISCSVRMIRLMLKDRGNEIVYIAACFCMMALFLHLKGFVHDTWHERYLWLYSGSMLGLAYNPALFKHSLRLVANRHSPVATPLD